MNITAMAQRALADLTDPSDKLHLIVTAMLVHELIEMLPQLIKQGCCRFEDGARDRGAFAHTEGPSSQHLYTQLRIDLDGESHRINFNGLMIRFGGDEDEKAAEIVQAILEQKFSGFDASESREGLSAETFDTVTFHKVPITRADINAMRTYCPKAPLRIRVEIAGFYWALGWGKGIEGALRILPSPPPESQRVQASQRLTPVVEHLQELVETLTISALADSRRVKKMISSLLDDLGVAHSLDKLVAIAGAHKLFVRDEKELNDAIWKNMEGILNMHFGHHESQGPCVPLSHIDWLIRQGDLLANYADRSSGEVRDKVDAVLAHQLSLGKAAAVFHFVRTYLRNFGDDRKDANYALKCMAQDLAHKALEEAMRERRYGIAAAIAQSFSQITVAERNHALDMAILSDQRITMQWAHASI
jgi:hypothetical protein